MKIEIITPEKVSYSEEADQVSLPTAEGEITILPNHIYLLTQLLPGELSIRKGDQTIVMASGGGFAEITGNKVSIATDLALKSEEINEKQAEEARKRAEEAMKDRERLSEEEFALTAASLQKSLAQLRVKRRHRRNL